VGRFRIIYIEAIYTLYQSWVHACDNVESFCEYTSSFDKIFFMKFVMWI